MIALNRRRVMGGADKYMLLHHWEASDWEGGNAQWIDRVGGVALDKVGTPTYDNGYMVVKSGTNAFRQMYMNSWLFLGDDFKIVVEGMYPDNLTDYTFMVDFGSVTTANHAFCFALDKNGTVFHNAKITGNSSNETNEVPVGERLYIPPITPFEYEFGIVRVSDEYNRLYSSYRGEIRYGGSLLTRAQATFDLTNRWLTQQFYIGCGVSVTVGDSQNKWIKSVKIYKLKE